MWSILELEKQQMNGRTYCILELEDSTLSDVQSTHKEFQIQVQWNLLQFSFFILQEKWAQKYKIIWKYMCIIMTLSPVCAPQSPYIDI